MIGWLIARGTYRGTKAMVRGTAKAAKPKQSARKPAKVTMGAVVALGFVFIVAVVAVAGFYSYMNGRY